MFTLYRLPYFMDYLALHYQQLYRIYVGKLTELFPSAQAEDDALIINGDEATTKETDEELRKLWKKFIRRFS